MDYDCQINVSAGGLAKVNQDKTLQRLEELIAIGEAVELGVPRGEIGSNEVCIDLVNRAVGTGPGNCQADRAITTAEIKRPLSVFQLDVLNKKVGPVVDTPGTEQAPGAVVYELVSAQRHVEDDVSLQFL